MALTGIERAVDVIGGQTALANRLDPPVVQQTVYNWVNRGWVPPTRARQIRAIAAEEGADIPVQDLVKPELAMLMEGAQ